MVDRGFSIDAHCSNPDHYLPGNPCRLDRQTSILRGPLAKGRPLGLVLAWLKHGAACTTRAQHKDAVKPGKQTPADKAALSQDGRAVMREWGMLNGLSSVASSGRAKRALEPDEPVGLP